MAKPLYGLGLSLLAGHALLKGLRSGAEQDTRFQDYVANMKDNLNTPLPSMTVMASYEAFAQEKRAQSVPDFPSSYFPSTTPRSAMGTAAANQLAAKLVGDPIESLTKGLKKKIYDEPAWNKNFENVVSSDPMLSKHYAEKPEVLHDVFTSMKRFSPSLAKDKNATRSFLRNAMMSGGEVDYSSMRMLAETEKFLNEAKRR